MTTHYKISCQNLWKIYSTGSEHSALLNPSKLDADDLRRRGFIVAVQDASVSVSEGEIFVIMGLSGSGKSTLVRCLSRLIDATAGSVIFDGQDITAVSESELIDMRRHKMGMVFQHFALLPHLTILGNVAFPLEIQGMGRKTREARALDMIDLVGLKGREDYYPGELSGGQQQRVGIARSLAVEPDVWFLDEPFSALDPLIRREMQDEFLRLQNTLHKTIVFITHDIDEAIRVADRIAIMKDGEIIQTGTPEDLVLRPATPYVAEFTRDVPRAKVLSAASIMRPMSDNEPIESCASRIDADMTIEALAPVLSDAGSAAVVVDAQGHVVGRIERESVIDVLMGTDPM